MMGRSRFKSRLGRRVSRYTQRVLKDHHVYEHIDELGVYMAKHPVIALVVFAVVISCGIPVLLFLVFAVVTILLTFTGFVIVEGTQEMYIEACICACPKSSCAPGRKSVQVFTVIFGEHAATFLPHSSLRRLKMLWRQNPICLSGAGGIADIKKGFLRSFDPRAREEFDPPPSGIGTLLTIASVVLCVFLLSTLMVILTLSATMGVAYFGFLKVFGLRNPTPETSPLAGFISAKVQSNSRKCVHSRAPSTTFQNED
uniref:Uncharacterized protein n=1 Tax=Timema genevievae TaxID=629358 RepID=A0A7R9JZA7_TIMGE|nr:unnamed protein product [Timema genevievae]